MSNNVTLRKALKTVRNYGFSTVKDNTSGSWYISKPYYAASALSFTNGIVTHVWVYDSNRRDSVRITWEQFVTDIENVPF